MEIGEVFTIATKVEDQEFRILEKGIVDQTTGKKGYLAISTDKEHPGLKFWSYSQFHVLKSQGVIKRRE